MKASDVKDMREAVEYASRVLAKWLQDAPFSAWNEYGEAIDRCRAALAAPLRNCDVGTAEEQCDRFLRFCQSRGCVNCEIGDGNRAKFPSCELVWAQMPYEEGGAK